MARGSLFYHETSSNVNTKGKKRFEIKSIQFSIEKLEKWNKIKRKLYIQIVKNRLK